MSEYLAIAEQFDFPAPVSQVEPYGNGIVNDTYVVTFRETTQKKSARLGRRAILQRINDEVFPRPTWIMQNLQCVIEHVQNSSAKLGDAHPFILPPVYRSRSGAAYYQDQAGKIWRATGFIEQTSSFNVIQDSTQAYEVGVALGLFHRLVGDLPPQLLKDTLPGFHVTPRYLQHFDDVWCEPDIQAQYRAATHPAVSECLQIVESHRHLATVLEQANPPLPLRVIHGDPKLNNFLFDKRTGQAISLIDLDTVKPGLLHYDLGDCIRSCCNISGEQPVDINAVQFDCELCSAILQGYLQSAGNLVRGQDLDLLYDCIRLLPFELGLRFLTDHLQGDCYFKVHARGDNLYRAQVQFRLLHSIEQQESIIRDMIDPLRQFLVNSG